jgi:signal transduction histidine kinase
VTNAVKFTPEGGRIDVAAVRRGYNVEISVSDTGIGIAPADRERIFEEFVQLDRAHMENIEGTGLGLALSRRLLTLMGGSIAVDSDVGVGSTFRVRLPAGRPHARAEARAGA